jgi:hypothetical protein
MAGTSAEARVLDASLFRMPSPGTPSRVLQTANGGAGAGTGTGTGRAHSKSSHRPPSSHGASVGTPNRMSMRLASPTANGAFSPPPESHLRRLESHPRQHTTSEPNTPSPLDDNGLGLGHKPRLSLFIEPNLDVPTSSGSGAHHQISGTSYRSPGGPLLTSSSSSAGRDGMISINMIPLSPPTLVPPSSLLPTASMITSPASSRVITQPFSGVLNNNINTNNSNGNGSLPIMSNTSGGITATLSASISASVSSSSSMHRKPSNASSSPLLGNAPLTINTPTTSGGSGTSPHHGSGTIASTTGSVSGNGGIGVGGISIGGRRPSTTASAIMPSTTAAMMVAAPKLMGGRRNSSSPVVTDNNSSDGTA